MVFFVFKRLCERQVEINVTFTYNGDINVPDLLTIIPLVVLPYYLRIPPTFKTKCHSTNKDGCTAASLDHICRTVNGLLNINYFTYTICNLCFFRFILLF